MSGARGAADFAAAEVSSIALTLLLLGKWCSRRNAPLLDAMLMMLQSEAAAAIARSAVIVLLTLMSQVVPCRRYHGYRLMSCHRDRTNRCRWRAADGTSSIKTLTRPERKTASCAVHTATGNTRRCECETILFC
jgi:hypothetical protein